MNGADGVSVVSRQTADALRGEVGRTLASLEVWSLDDRAAPAGFEAPAVSFRGAGGSRLGFATRGLRERLVSSDTLVVVMHVHLMPVVLPLIQRGARVIPLLLGIEAWKPLAALERVAMLRAWRIAAISSHTVARFRDANPLLAHLPVAVCHPGVRTGTLGTESYGPRRANREPFALIVGRMSSRERYKGHDELLETWPAVRAAVPGARLVIAGTGDDEPRLRARAAALGLGEAVTFEGAVDDARLAALYRDAACFAMPSRDEGFGLVFLEAMRAGTPCIAARGAAEEIIEHGLSGLIVDPSDRDALASALVRLLSDGPARDAMGREAARRVAARFEAAHFAARLLRLLDLVPAEVAC